MTPLVEFVRENGFDALRELGIFTYEHPELPLIGVTYRLDKDKFHPVVRASRGTVLELDSLNVVAQPFYRFYNIGEHEESDKTFDFNNCRAYDKEDGSLIIAYHYDGRWHAKTSGSFGYAQVQSISGSVGVAKTFSDLFWETYDGKELDPSLTYMFELCTPWNRIVKPYLEPTVYLLAARENSTLRELTHDEYVYHANELGVRTPHSYLFSSADEVIEFVSSQDTPYYEGVVLRDANNNRLKVKNPEYVRLHHRIDNHPIEIILKGEKDETLVYFPYMKDELEDADHKVRVEFEEVWRMWEANKNAPTRKEFALAIVGKTKYTGILFQYYGHEVTKDEMYATWCENILASGYKKYGIGE